MKKQIAIMAVSLLAAVAGYAGPAVATTTYVDPTTVPIVPINIVCKGRQAVVDYLVPQVNHVQIDYSGGSMIPGQSRYFGPDELSQLGYTNKGSFSQLSESIGSAPLSLSIIPRPEGYYDVRASLSFDTIDGRQALQGNGYLNVQTDWKTGTLTGGEFQPWVWVNPNLMIRMPSDLYYSASWVGKNYANPVQLQVYIDNDGTGIILPEQAIGDGYLLAWDGYNLKGYDLSNGNVLQGQQIRAVLGKIGSSDIQVIKNSSTVSLTNSTFYSSEGKIYGRVPLTELVLDQSTSESLSPSVTVWGTTIVLQPDSVYVKPIGYKSGAQTEAGMSVGVEYSVPQPTSGSTGWKYVLPAGIYHIRVVFDSVYDWDQDPDPKG